MKKDWQNTENEMQERKKEKEEAKREREETKIREDRATIGNAINEGGRTKEAE